MPDTLEEKIINEEQDKMMQELAVAVLSMPHGWSLRKTASGRWQVWDYQGPIANPASVREIIDELSWEII